MRRILLLFTVMVLLTAMLVASAAPALAAIRPPIAGIMGGGGTPLHTVACEVVAEDDGSGLIGWSNRTCWVFHPVTVSDF